MTKPKRKVGRDTAWPHSPLVDGVFRELLGEYEAALEDLAVRLSFAEEAAAIGSGQSESGMVSGGTSRGVEVRLQINEFDMEMADTEVRELRKLRDKWRKALRVLVRDAQVDLGQRAPLKGPRDKSGRLKILTSEQGLARPASSDS